MPRLALTCLCLLVAAPHTAQAQPQNGPIRQTMKPRLFPRVQCEGASKELQTKVTRGFRRYRSGLQRCWEKHALKTELRTTLPLQFSATTSTLRENYTLELRKNFKRLKNKAVKRCAQKHMTRTVLRYLQRLDVNAPQCTVQLQWFLARH